MLVVASVSPLWREVEWGSGHTRATPAILPGTRSSLRRDTTCDSNALQRRFSRVGVRSSN